MAGIILLLLLGIGLTVLGFILPYQRSQSTMPAGGELVIEQQPEGNLKLNWPEADRADYYCVEIEVPAESEEAEPELLYKDYIQGMNYCFLPELPSDTELTVRISSVIEYSTFGQEKIRYGEESLEVTTVFQTPKIRNFQWEADSDTRTITATFETESGNHCRYYLMGENGQRLESYFLQGNAIEITFGDQGDYPMPDYDQVYHLAFDAYREEPGLKFYGYLSAEMTVNRDDLLGRSLNLSCTDEGYNVYTLTWDETKGEYYEVQVIDGNARMWTTVAQIPADGERTYTTPHLDIFREYTYRVVAAGGQLMEGSEYAAISEEKTVETGESPVYATIWPTKSLAAYSDPQKTTEVGKVEVGKAYCVLEEREGMFAVRLDGQKVYIDSNYCMINLPEYLGDQCAYEITNSYSSIYMVHEFEIPRVTDVVTAGYENVELADGSYLVPLLYPTAKKLAVAAQSAIDQGYRLKIYDAFRPYKATREIYDLTAKILDNELPEEPFTDANIKDLNLPEPQVVTTETTDGEEASTETTEGKKILTYRMVMLGDRYSLGAFLAKGGSLHNLGIAVDLTLEKLDNGKEVKMQTSMHDLSQYSVLSKNNSNAKLLNSIMTGAGLGELTSEWWHFQDNEARSQLSPPTVSNGISANCWMADDNGWRYRTRKGTYYAGETVTIDEVQYTFDDDGYLIE